MEPQEPELGDVARDRVSGFEGVVVCESRWLHGCRRVSLAPRTLKDGNVIPFQTFDAPQLEVVTKRVVETSWNRPAGERTGGDAEAPTQHSDPESRP
jgi:hypothetical protein